MNSTDFNENSSLEGYETVVRVMFQFSVPLLLLYFITYPFYVFVNKVNRQRDKKMTIFPITNHFYLMMKATFPALLCFSYSLVYQFFHQDTPENEQNGFLYRFNPLLMACSCYLLYLGNQIFHVLIVSLAIERFLIYFRPTIEKRIVSLQNYISKKIEFVYVAFFIKDFIYGVALMIDFVKHDQAKLTLWRIIFLLTIPVIVAPLLNFRDIFMSGSIQLIMEMITIPLLITTSYLGCNKRNVTVLMSSFNLKHFLRVIFGCENAAVEPQQYIVSIHSTL